MNELQEFFNSVAVEQKKVAEEKARQEYWMMSTRWANTKVEKTKAYGKQKQ